MAAFGDAGRATIAPQNPAALPLDDQRAVCNDSAPRHRGGTQYSVGTTVDEASSLSILCQVRWLPVCAATCQLGAGTLTRARASPQIRIATPTERERQSVFIRYAPRHLMARAPPERAFPRRLTAAWGHMVYTYKGLPHPPL